MVNNTLDKGFFKEVPSVDSSWSESIHLSLGGSSKSERENTDHKDILRYSKNTKQAYYTEDTINMIVDILILVPQEGIFPQFSHELTLDLEVDIALDFWFNHTGAWFPRDNAEYCSMVRKLMSTPAIVPVDLEV
ncbi:hypothetical protein Tco_0031304 [Tanacetum coccineum]